MNKKIISRQLRKLLLEKKGDSHKYGCAMLSVNVSNSDWDRIQSLIDDEDVYEEEGDKSYGREDDPHITLLYGLHDIVTDEDVKKVSNEMSVCEVNLKKISIFEGNENFDVVKFDIVDDSKKLLQRMNEKYTDFPHTNDYPVYHPHCTIAYVKAGTGKKYSQTLSDDEMITSKCDKIVYSKADGTENIYKLRK